MPPQTQKISLWTAGLFYALVVLEFIYMATPFGAFFYSVYKPVLHLAQFPAPLSWLGTTFLPHIVQDTKSSLLDARDPIGISLFSVGFLGFVTGAAQVYYAKLFRKTVVATGIYKVIRHPQYASLMIWGLGLTLLWPRTIVLLSFVTMVFVYYLLATIEERECERNFGSAYTEYEARTGMFFPRLSKKRASMTSVPQSGAPRYIGLSLLYVVSLVVALGLSALVRAWSLNSLYALYDNRTAFISVTAMEKDSLKKIVDIALSSPEVRERLNLRSGDSTYCINYIVPDDFYTLEIPMNEVPGASEFHFASRVHSGERSRIIFTEVESTTVPSGSVKSILGESARLRPILEVSVDVATKKVVDIQPPAAHPVLSGVALPVF